MTECKVPPAGWTCLRTSGHEGPCAARRLRKWAVRHVQKFPGLEHQVAWTTYHRWKWLAQLEARWSTGPYPNSGPCIGVIYYQTCSVVELT